MFRKSIFFKVSKKYFTMRIFLYFRILDGLCIIIDGQLLPALSVLHNTINALYGILKRRSGAWVMHNFLGSVVLGGLRSKHVN